MNGNEHPLLPKPSPKENIEALAVRIDGTFQAFGYDSDVRTVSNWLFDGPIKASYESPTPGEPPTWMNAGHIEILIRDGSVLKLPFKVKQSDAENGTDWVSAVCGTDTVTDDPDNVLIDVFLTHRDNPNAFPRRTAEMFRDDSGVYERAFKLADIPVRIVDAKKDAWGQFRYIVEGVNRLSGGTPVKLAVTHDELNDGSWLHGLGGRTSNRTKLAMALVNEFKHGK